MKLLFGCGYLGARVARLWHDAGDEVGIVTRDAAKAARLQAEGFHSIIADVCNPAALRSLPTAETVLYAVGYDRQSTPAYSIGEVYAGGVRNVLEALSALRFESTPLFIYVSSTGVYGDADGDWVDEDTPCRPQRDGGKACLAAEEVLAEHPLGDDSVVLRLAGIYGPGRIPRADVLRRGDPIDAPAEGYLNLIHVDDAARTVLAVEHAVAPPRTYCVSDGRPPLRRDYYAELARLLGAPAPTFVQPTSNSPAAARAAADKRISNARLLREIGVELQYPSYREGLAAIVGSS